MTRALHSGLAGLGLLTVFAWVSGCAAPTLAPRPAPTVSATAETDPVASADDAADDPAIWRNAADPKRSLIVGTDKKAGIHVHDLSGKRVGFTPAPRLNNVDLRGGIDVAGKPSVLVVASDRADIAKAKAALFTLDTASGTLSSLGSFDVGPGEAYGMCLWVRASDRALFAFLVLKDGRIDQVAIDAAGPRPRLTRVRSMKLGTQSEGCVVDDRTGILYVAEEDVGLWRFDADPSGSSEAIPVAKVDGRTLYADAEGLAIAPSGADGGYLLASSQGDNAYALYQLPGLAFVGRFRIAGGSIDAVSETDGIEVMLGDFGPAFPRGLLVAQDGDNAPSTQNFKLVDWDAIRRALNLKL